MAAKTARVYTLDELKEKCQTALADSNLADIARTTPSSAYKRAFEYVYSRTNDLQTAKKLAVATRFLAMLHRDFKEEFEKLTSQKVELPNASKEKQKKHLHDFEFDLPKGAELITKEMVGVSDYDTVRKISIKFEFSYVVDFIRKILEALREIGLYDSAEATLRNAMINYLEEKFGLKIKVCGNCKHFSGGANVLNALAEPMGAFAKILQPLINKSFGGCTLNGGYQPVVSASSTCQNNGWALKEVSTENKEKTASETRCGM